MSEENILITGGFGLIGSNLIKILLKKKFNIIVIDNFSNGSFKSLKLFKKFSKKNNITFYKIDLNNFSKVKSVFEKHSIKYVIHLAAISSISMGIKYPKKVLYNNINSTRNLVRLAKKFSINYFIFSSSASVYGNINFKKNINENSRTVPLNAYAKSKIICEKLIKKYSTENSYKFCIFRYFNVVGKNFIHNEKKKNHMNLFETINYCIKKKKIFKIHGKYLDTFDGTPIRDFIYIDDLVSAHYKTLKIRKTYFWNNIYNIGYNNGVSVLEIINETKRIFKDKLKYNFININKSIIVKSVANNRKFLNRSNWKPKYSTVREIVNNYFLN